MARSLVAGLPAAVLDNAVAAVAGADPARPRSFTLSTARPDGTPRQLVATSVPHAATGTVVTTLRDLHTDRRADRPRRT